MGWVPQDLEEEDDGLAASVVGETELEEVDDLLQNELELYLDIILSHDRLRDDVLALEDGL